MDDETFRKLAAAMAAKQKQHFRQLLALLEKRERRLDEIVKGAKGKEARAVALECQRLVKDLLEGVREAGLLWMGEAGFYRQM